MTNKSEGKPRPRKRNLRSLITGVVAFGAITAASIGGLGTWDALNKRSRYDVQESPDKSFIVCKDKIRLPSKVHVHPKPNKLLLQYSTWFSSIFGKEVDLSAKARRGAYESGVRFYDAHISPDSEKIAFHQSRSLRSPAKLWVYNIETDKLTNVYEGDFLIHEWKKDELEYTCSGKIGKRIKSEVPFATSVPDPKATPTSAFLRAGASLIPSPVIATTSPLSCHA